VRAERFAERRSRLVELAVAEGLDGLVVTHLANVRYLTGFTGTAGMAAVLRQGTVFLSDFRYRTQSEAELGGDVRVEIASSDLWERLWQVLGEYAGIEVLGFEARAVSVADAERLASADGKVRPRLKPVQGLVERLRVTKDPDEVAAIREAGRLAAEALAATLPCVRPGQREREVAARLEHELRMRGSEWHPFPTIVASGPRSALPHARTSDREIVPGDWLLLDFGAQVDGYCADLTRTVVVGARADERQRAVYHLVRQAQQAARQGLRAGMTGREADALARSVLEARGFGEAFGHSLGHGLGLELHEGPRLSRTNEEPLPAGAVVTIEPGAYFPGWGGVRLEDDVWLGPDGAELLTDGRTELIELL
jgi:Xaa-Pro aminopeptidase